jgi:hypothetical protein
MAACSGTLAAELRRQGKRRRRAVLGAGGAVLVLALASAGYLLMRGPVPKPYDLHLSGVGGAAEVLLIQGDDGHSGSPTEGRVHFELLPGRYEVFIDGKYTGRVLHVPADSSPVEIAVPGS